MAHTRIFYLTNFPLFSEWEKIAGPCGEKRQVSRALADIHTTVFSTDHTNCTASLQLRCTGGGYQNPGLFDTFFIGVAAKKNFSHFDE
jgi:hypothetical protein